MNRPFLPIQAFKVAISGLTLTEIVIASSIMMVIMIPVAMSFSSGVKGIQMTHEEIVGHAAAMELIEQLSSAPFDLLPAGKYENNHIRDGALIRQPSPLVFHISTVEGIERECSIEELVKDGKTRFKKITVTVKVHSNKDEFRTVTLKSLLANEKI